MNIAAAADSARNAAEATQAQLGLGLTTGNRKMPAEAAGCQHVDEPWRT